VINHTFDLFDKLGATEEQLDFPVVYASALNGYAMLDDAPAARHRHAPAVRGHPQARAAPGRRRRPAADADLLARLLQLRRPHRHRPHHARPHRTQEVPSCVRPEAKPRQGKRRQVLGFKGLEREQSPKRQKPATSCWSPASRRSASASRCATRTQPEACPAAVDEPTLTMNFQVNTSPLAGRKASSSPAARSASAWSAN
jgi:GTP-binding protein